MPSDQSGRSRSPQVTFVRTFYVVATLLWVLALLVGTLVTGQIMGGFIAAAFCVIGTSCGMVWKAERVIAPAREQSP